MADYQLRRRRTIEWRPPGWRTGTRCTRAGTRYGRQTMAAGGTGVALVLSVTNGGTNEIAAFPLPPRECVIGRAPDADWTLPDPSQRVSSSHCRVRPLDGGFELVDLSTNGTLVNGQPLAAPRRLQAGDRLTIGHYEIVATAAAGANPVAGGATGARLDLSRWDRPPPTTAPAAPPGNAAAASAASAPATATGAPSQREQQLAAALATLLATRARQRRELGVTAADPFAANPLARPPAEAAAALAGAVDPAAAVTAATAAVERHHAATLAAMRDAFRATREAFSPAAVATAAGAVPPAGDARDAALWRAYLRLFDGADLGERGFAERFAAALRFAYERLPAVDGGR